MKDISSLEKEELAEEDGQDDLSNSEDEEDGKAAGSTHKEVNTIARMIIQENPKLNNDDAFSEGEEEETAKKPLR